MDEDLDRVKDQLEELDKALEEMKDSRKATKDRSNDSDRTGETGTAPDTRSPSGDIDASQERPRSTEKDRTEAIEAQETEQTDDTSQTGSGDDPHPSPLERFRDKLDHGHEAADQEHFQEAQKIYRSLIQEYRGLKHRDKLTDEDEKRLHTLYEKVDRAKE